VVTEHRESSGCQFGFYVVGIILHGDFENAYAGFHCQERIVVGADIVQVR
jgi:hypothetical protein